MSDAIKGGGTVPAAGSGKPGQATVETGALLFSGRTEAAKSLATEVLKSFADLPETVVEKRADGVSAEPKAEGADETVLSQAKIDAEAKVSPPPVEPEWSAEQQRWFAKMEAAGSDAERDALQQEAPEFTPEQLAWLQGQEGQQQQQPQGEDLIGDPELKGKLDPKTQEAINRRIAKEVAKTKALQEQLEQTAAKLKELETKPAATVTGPEGPKGPLAEVHDVAGLQRVAQEAERALDQTEALLDRLADAPGEVEQALREAKVVLKDAEGQEDYSPERMKRYLDLVRKNADRTLRRELPAREQFVKQADAYAGEVLTQMPELKEPQSERRKLFDSVVASVPWLKSRPDWPRVAAVYVLGLEAYAKANGAAKTAAAPAATVAKKRPVPVTIPSPRGVATAPRAATTRQAEAATLGQRALNGDKKARLEYLKGLV